MSGPPHYQPPGQCSQKRICTLADARTPLDLGSFEPQEFPWQEQDLKLLQSQDINASLVIGHGGVYNKRARIKLESDTDRKPDTEYSNNDTACDTMVESTDNKVSRLAWVVDAFSKMPENTRSYLLFQLLKRSSTSTLQFVNSVVAPALKRDFFTSLPAELTLHILSYLDAKSLCRAACVSRQWRLIIDSAVDTWKRLLEQEGCLTSADTRLTMDNSFRNDSDACPSPGAENDDMQIDSDSMHDERPSQESAIYYKDLYRHHHVLQHNWRHGRAKRIWFPAHQGHTITCLQFDQEKIISGADDCIINIFDITTGECLRTLAGHEGGVWALQYVGNTLVSGSTDRTVRVWDIERAVCTHVFPGHGSTVRCLQIIQPTCINGRMEPKFPLIATGSRDSTIRIWRLPDPKHDPPFNGIGHNPWLISTLIGHGHSVRALAAHGNRLVSGSYDSTVCVWDIEHGRLLHRMDGHSQRVYTVVIDPDRGQCISGSMDGTVRIWDMETGSCLKRLEGHSILVGLLALTPNYLVSGAADSHLRIWSPESGACEHVLSGHTGAITCFQHDEHKVVSGSEDGLKMWDIKTGKKICDLITGVNGVWRVAFDRRRCVAAVQRGNVAAFEVLDFGYYNLEDTSL